jgi:hypothetical protein
MLRYNGSACLVWRQRVVLRGSSANVTSPLSRSGGGAILGRRSRWGTA